MSNLVCAACGSSNVTRITKGIDNWPLGACRTCFPGARKHYPMTPLITAEKWREPTKTHEAPSVGAFD